MSRAVLQIFEEYQKARMTFVQTVADLATRPENIDALQNAGVMNLLRPLLDDNVASVKQSAALALGRLANYSDELAEAVKNHDILPSLVESLSHQHRFHKKASAFVIRAVAKHSPSLAHAVCDSNALDSLVHCLQDFDSSVKEGAVWAIGYIARHTKDLADKVVEANAVQYLVLCIQEPELTLKRISVSALSDICKHHPDLASTVVEAGAVPLLAKDISHNDAPLKRQVCQCLAHIAKHSVELAEIVVEAEIFPRILHCLKDGDEYVRKNAATCVREISRHNLELAKVIVNSGGVAAMVEYVNVSRGNARLPGIMTLGYIAAFSDTLALAVLVSKGITPLRDALISEREDHLKAASAYALGQIGRHSTDHARALAEADVLRRLLAVYVHVDSTEDLKTKSKQALKGIIRKCNHLPALQPLLEEAPDSILKYVVQQLAKVLPLDAAARKHFVESGGLAKIQDAKADNNAKLIESIEEINNLYPQDIVHYYSAGYKDTLLKKLDDFNPTGQ
mmetsp:Transcript_110566/g.174195  ORF Transcript_110566/g.174195 Transcript_110566/m.174195 type:complete len:509 (+) Transcript_110566:79-1605(+)|eukprot:CAMPEP_0169123772 /NCGR_PEP_ID=MMETSP1015-20121227/33967_1 /TAXON_ID=342587 /ORGANISM="Karlodinium micrum, Strain CCMP2283" /LENGTH=508 /DNA_ID=CAMNT_0009187139 /DNA_START=74 /DNA_END=1600 /DNA_ORIENTATION=-